MVRPVHSPLDRLQNRTHTSSSSPPPSSSFSSHRTFRTLARKTSRVAPHSGESATPVASRVVSRSPSSAPSPSSSSSLSPSSWSSLSFVPTSPSLSPFPSPPSVPVPPQAPSFWYGTSFSTVLLMQKLKVSVVFLLGMAFLFVMVINSTSLYNRPVRTPIVGSSTPQDNASTNTPKPPLSQNDIVVPDDSLLNLNSTDEQVTNLDKDRPAFPFESALETLLAVVAANKSSLSSLNGAPSTDALRTFHSLVIENYLKFHRKANSPHTSHNCKHTKCLIARVDESPTHGLGDRMRGIVTSYFAAVMTGRVFMIDWKTPLPVTHALYPWTTDIEVLERGSLPTSSASAVGPHKTDNEERERGQDKRLGSRRHAIDDGFVTVNNFTYSFIGDDMDFVLGDEINEDLVKKLKEYTARLTSTKCCCCRYPLSPTITVHDYEVLLKQQKEKGQSDIPLIDPKTQNHHFRMVTNGNLYHTELKYANVHTLYMDSVPAPNVTRWFQPPPYRKAGNKLLNKLSTEIKLRDAIAMTALHVIPLILQAIFTPSQALRARIAERMPLELKRTGWRDYIAVHARLGYGLEEESLDAGRFDLELKGLSVKAMAECFASKVMKLGDNPNSKSDHSSSTFSPLSRSSANGNAWSHKKKKKTITVFVATDTPQFRTMFADAMEKAANDISQGNRDNMSTADVVHSFNVVAIDDLVPVHIRDITMKQADKEKAVNDLLDTFVDLFLLGRAGTLVHLESGFSDLAMWMGCSTRRVVMSRDTCAERYGTGTASVKTITHDIDGNQI